MVVSYKPLGSVFETGAQMKRLSTQYFTDLLPFKRFSLPQFFDYVCKLPYIPDPNGIEFIQRPAASLSKDAKHRDCDCKAIAIGSFLILQGLGKRFRFVATSKKIDQALHHVLVEWDCGNGCCIFLDATYAKNRMFMQKKYTKTLPICDWVEVSK